MCCPPDNADVKEQDAHGCVFVMWSLPGALIWFPTAANVFIAAEILELLWERVRGTGNTAQGEIGPFMHIIAISAPIAVVILFGWAVFAVLRAKVQRSPEEKRQPGVAALAILNIAAPVLLYFGLKSLA